MTAAAALLLAHISVVATLGITRPGPFLSDCIQLIMGGVMIFACFQASERSEGLARSFWRLAAASYMVWWLGQSTSTSTDLFVAPASVDWVANLFFSFWFAPLAMAMFLDPDNEEGGLDPLIALDFLQAIVVCVAAYLYFFYLPKAGGRLGNSVWTPYLVAYVFVAGAFLVRAIASRSRVVRMLFGRMGLLLALSVFVDVLYYYGPGQNLKTGAWFDILWSVAMVVPIIVAATWKQPEPAVVYVEAPGPEKHIPTEIFHLSYPLLVLFMSLRIAREHLALAAAVVFLSFVVSSARLLVTQHRLVLAQEALRREASRDSLTSLWNRKAILDILQRELLRTERRSESVGVIMADIDHFKDVNDSRGHAAGDLVLRIIASEIAAVVRPYDSVGRYGGEEFLVVAPDCSIAETWELAERIRSCVAHCSVEVGGTSVQVSLSLGIAIGRSATDSEQLLHAADVALYQAKNAGRNRVEPSTGRAAAAGQSASSPTAYSKFWL